MRERSPRPPTLIPDMAWFLRRPLRAHGVGLTAALVCACAHAGPAQNTAPATRTNSLGMVFQQVPAGRFTMGGAGPPDTPARAATATTRSTTPPPPSAAMPLRAATLAIRGATRVLRRGKTIPS